MASSYSMMAQCYRGNMGRHIYSRDEFVAIYIYIRRSFSQFQPPAMLVFCTSLDRVTSRKPRSAILYSVMFTSQECCIVVNKLASASLGILTEFDELAGHDRYRMERQYLAKESNFTRRLVDLGYTGGMIRSVVISCRCRPGCRRKMQWCVES